MSINSLLYSFKQGLLNIIRNKMFSLASVATMAACIFMFGIFYILISNFTAIIKDAEENVGVTVFFDQGVGEDKIEEIRVQIKKRAEVSKIEYVSAKEAWDTFQVEYFKGYETAAESFGDENPLANSANLEVYLNDISMQSSLVSYIERIDGVRKVNQSKDIADTLTDLNKLLSYNTGGIILILLCVAIFLISNTVTIGISVRKEEIGIMKLIGATDYFVRAPFVVEGVVIGLVGALLPLLLLFIMYDRICVYIAERFNLIGDMIKFLPAGTVFKTLVPVALLLGVGIGFLGSRFTIRKHLKV